MLNSTNNMAVVKQLSERLRAAQPDLNVGKLERFASALLGSTLIIAALRRAPLAWLLGVCGAVLLLRAFSGRSAMYQAIGRSSHTAPVERAEPDNFPETDSLIDDASAESFPASDPPAFNA